MQYIVNQNDFFITIKWGRTNKKGNYPSTNSINYYTQILRKYFDDLHMKNIGNTKMIRDNGFFYLLGISNTTSRVEAYKGLNEKQHYCIMHEGIIAHIQWMGAISDIKQAVKVLHQKMKELKTKYPIIEKLTIFISGEDYTYNTTADESIVKDDINT